MLVAVVAWTYCLVSTCVRVMSWGSSSTKTDSGVTGIAVVLFVTKDTNSCFGVIIRTPGVKPFQVTILLQGGLRTNQRLPGVTTQWGVAVFSISDQWMQRSRGPFDYNKPGLVVNPHTEADLGEGCVPVGGKFGFLWVEPSFPSVKVEGFFVSPETGVVVKPSLLRIEKLALKWVMRSGGSKVKTWEGPSTHLIFRPNWGPQRQG